VTGLFGASSAFRPPRSASPGFLINPPSACWQCWNKFFLNIWHPGLPEELLQPDGSDIMPRIIAAEMEKFI
jgi:hypothetical protein